MGESTLLPAKAVAARDGMSLTVSGLGPIPLTVEPSPGSSLWLPIQPEFVEVGNNGVGLGEVLVEDVVFQGSFKRMTATSLDDPSIRFVLQLGAEAGIREGETVPLCCRANDIIVLPE